MTDKFAFSIAATDGDARTGAIAMPRGEIRTPAFMPVGTAATVKAMKPADVRATGADIILGNTYHLMLRPGAERVARLGGLHEFMGWDRPILTDSGGYQVMSLSELRKITEEGVAFQSHLDGSRHMLTPERSMEIQRLLGSDIVMAFDECPPTGADAKRAEGDGALDALGEASRDGVRRGRRHADARRAVRHPAGRARRGAARSARPRRCSDIGFDGYAIGGLAVGEGQEAMFGVLDFAPGQLARRHAALSDGRRQARRPRRRGRARASTCSIACCRPARAATARRSPGRGRSTSATPSFAEDRGPLDPAAPARPARPDSRAYLHHLIRAGEILGAMLMTEHNLSFYQPLMQGMRDAIAAGSFAAFQSDFDACYGK